MGFLALQKKKNDKKNFWLLTKKFSSLSFVYNLLSKNLVFTLGNNISTKMKQTPKTGNFENFLIIRIISAF